MKLITLTKSRYQDVANETVVVNIESINYMRSEVGSDSTIIQFNDAMVFVSESIDEVLTKIAGVES